MGLERLEKSSALCYAVFLKKHSKNANVNSSWFWIVST